MRARNIKPGFYKNDALAECSLLARFIFPGLWMMADRDGVLEDRPKRIKAELLPFDDADVDALLDELQSKGFIVRYKAENRDCIFIPKFTTHQHPHMRETSSNLPKPTDDQVKHSASTIQAPCKHSANPVQVQDKNSASTIQALEKHDTSPAVYPIPITESNKKETYKERKPPNAFSIPKPPDVTDQTWNDFVQLRKAKKAPVTETCIQGFRREAEKADITLEAALSVTVLHGWQGFKADWLRNKKRQSNGGYAKPPPKTNQRYDDVCENLPDDFYPPPGAYDLRDFDLNGKLIKKEGK